MRYTYLGDMLTDRTLIGLQCDPVRRADGKCVVNRKLASALVVDAQGKRYVVKRRRLRVNPGYSKGKKKCRSTIIRT
jgi:hypothetical protein